MECYYQLSWLPYEKSVIDLYRNSLSAKSLMDITLLCEGKEIHAHKLVLSVMSLYFQDIILNHPSDSQMIVMYNVKYDDMKCIIDYMYSGKLYVLHDRFRVVKDLLVNLKVRGMVDTSLEVNSASQDFDFVPQNSQHLNSTHQPENEPELSEPQLQESISLLQPRIAPFQQKMQQVQDLKQKKEPESTTTAEQQSCSSVTAAESETTLKPQTQSKAKVVDEDNTTFVSSSTNSLKKYGASKNSQQSSNIVEVTKQCIFCNGHRRGPMILVGKKGREILMNETQDNNDGIYQKLLDYDEIYLHGKCKRSYTSPPPSHSKQLKKGPKLKERKRITLSTSESSESESNISMHLDDSSELDLDLE